MMLTVNGKRLCEHCFTELPKKTKICPYCTKERNRDKYPTALTEGVILIGRYAVGRVLGKGGFGVTYLCYDLKDDKKVAIKEYLPDSLSHRNSGETHVSTYGGEKDQYFQTGAKRFYDEAKIVSRFNGNPNIISVYEFFFENNTTYFVMEYLDGLDFKHYIADKGGKISEAEALFVLERVSDALMIVHSTGILHRDISPDNIFLCTNGDVKLIDFGAARQVVGEASKSLSVILKQGFAPLEQYQKRGKQGPWTDLYALGATIYYALTGTIPDDAMTRLDEESIDMKGISPELAAILTKMLAVRAENRYRSMLELKTDYTKVGVKSKAPTVQGETHAFSHCQKCGKQIDAGLDVCSDCLKKLKLENENKNKKKMRTEKQPEKTSGEENRKPERKQKPEKKKPENKDSGKKSEVSEKFSGFFKKTDKPESKQKPEKKKPENKDSGKKSEIPGKINGIINNTDKPEKNKDSKEKAEGSGKKRSAIDKKYIAAAAGVLVVAGIVAGISIRSCTRNVTENRKLDEIETSVTLGETVEVKELLPQESGEWTITMSADTDEIISINNTAITGEKLGRCEVTINAELVKDSRHKVIYDGTINVIVVLSEEEAEQIESGIASLKERLSQAKELLETVTQDTAVDPANFVYEQSALENAIRDFEAKIDEIERVTDIEAAEKYYTETVQPAVEAMTNAYQIAQQVAADQAAAAGAAAARPAATKAPASKSTPTQRPASKPTVTQRPAPKPAPTQAPAPKPAPTRKPDPKPAPTQRALSTPKPIVNR